MAQIASFLKNKNKNKNPRDAHYELTLLSGMPRCFKVELGQLVMGSPELYCFRVLPRLLVQEQAGLTSEQGLCIMKTTDAKLYLLY
jgi:hypothetical protein